MCKAARSWLDGPGWQVESFVLWWKCRAINSLLCPSDCTVHSFLGSCLSYQRASYLHKVSTRAMQHNVLRTRAPLHDKHWRIPPIWPPNTRRVRQAPMQPGISVFDGRRLHSLARRCWSWTRSFRGSITLVDGSPLFAAVKRSLGSLFLAFRRRPTANPMPDTNRDVGRSGAMQPSEHEPPHSAESRKCQGW